MNHTSSSNVLFFTEFELYLKNRCTDPISCCILPPPGSKKGHNSMSGQKHPLSSVLSTLKYDTFDVPHETNCLLEVILLGGLT